MSNSPNFTHILSPDTQAILLLCASFGRSPQSELKPLSLGDYNYLAQHLQEHQRRPADLLTIEGQDWLRNTLGDRLEPQRVVSLLDRGAMLAVAVEKWTTNGIWIISRSDAIYPQQLKQKLKQASPPIFYGAGDRTLFRYGGLAVVGSRDIGEDELNYTKRVAEKCAEQDIPIISGGARGVDRTAMVATLAQGGRAIGVLDKGLSKDLVAKDYRAGLQEGRLLLISPYDPNAGFNVGHAMSRNKHIYALADHALIVRTSSEKGGTWAGATEELKRDQSIPVWVWIHAQAPEGNLHLLNYKAKPFPTEPWNQHLLELLNTSQHLPLEDLLPQDLSHLASNVPTPEPTLFSSIETDTGISQTPKKSINGMAPDQQKATVPVTSNPTDSHLTHSEPPTLPNSSVQSEDDNTTASSGNNETVLPSAASDSQSQPTPHLPKDAYEAVLPLLQHHLSTEKTERQVADALDVALGQARLWLKRGVQDELLLKKKGGYYVCREAVDQLTIL